MKKTILFATLLGNFSLAYAATMLGEGALSFEGLDPVKDGQDFALVFDWPGADKSDGMVDLKALLFQDGIQNDHFNQAETSLFYRDGGWQARFFCMAEGVDITAWTEEPFSIESGTFVLQHTSEDNKSTFSYKILQDNELVTFASVTCDAYTNIYDNCTVIELRPFSGDPISNISAWEGVVTAADIASSSSIPEPATATLSLLALAGLAARRRRK